MATQNKNEKISALIVLNEDLENYFANTIIPQLFVDAQLVLRKFTPPAMKQFKLKPDDIGKSVMDIPDNLRFPTIIRDIQEVIDTEKTLQKEIQTTDKRWYQMNILPYLVRKENRSNGVIITFIDITIRIKDLKDHEQLIAENELLIDTIAHDIKNPLTALGMTIELLKRMPENSMEKFPVMLKNIESSFNKMRNIFYDLVQSRWQEHRYEPIDETLDLENILEDVRYTLAQQIQDLGALIKADIDDDQIFFSRRKLRSVIYNLVNNALKYSSPERRPEIDITSCKEDDFLVISVSDNGIGINPENKDSIFEKYKQINNSVDGDGVGLYLVKEILERSGGKITVESELNKGSLFKVYLKLNENPRKS